MWPPPLTLNATVPGEHGGDGASVHVNFVPYFLAVKPIESWLARSAGGETSTPSTASGLRRTLRVRLAELVERRREGRQLSRIAVTKFLFSTAMCIVMNTSATYATMPGITRSSEPTNTMRPNATPPKFHAGDRSAHELVEGDPHGHTGDNHAH